MATPFVIARPFGVIEKKPGLLKRCLRKIPRPKWCDQAYAFMSDSEARHVFLDTQYTRFLEYVTKEEDELNQSLSEKQEQFSRMITSWQWQSLSMVVIGSHVALTVVETDRRANNEADPLWHHLVCSSCVIYYLMELAVRLYLEKLRFFQTKLNQFDLVLVFIDVLGFIRYVSPSSNPAGGFMSVFRGLRVLRLLRVLRTLQAFRDLYLILQGLVGAVRAIIFGMLCLFAVITMFSVAAVEVVHPVNYYLATTGIYEGVCRA